MAEPHSPEQDRATAEPYAITQGNAAIEQPIPTERTLTPNPPQGRTGFRPAAAEIRTEPFIEPRIELTGDGSASLRHPLTGDLYHSDRGAVGEALHVYIGAGFNAFAGRHVRILEAGFGTGLNAWLTLREAARQQRTVTYHTVELYPIAPATAAALGYTDDPLFMRLHTAPWGASVRITEHFELRKTAVDLLSTEFDAIFDLIYFDAFAPSSQPQLWSPAIFRCLFRQLAPEGLLVTYSACGEVKRAMRAAGFRVERLPGALGKHHMLRATKE